MGGGGAMRTAAKLAGIGVGRSKILGSSAAQSIDQSVWNAQRTATTVLSSQGVKPAEVVPLQTAALWDLDDWELTDGEPMPRVVFDAVPTFQEAKEATTELKDAIDKIYLSSDSSQFEGSSPGSQVSVPSPTDSEPETNSCVIEAISHPSVPKHALQAFQLLSANTGAQTVVASIACDPNVWNAVMQNAAVSNFLQSHQKDAGFQAAETAEEVEELANATVIAGSEEAEEETHSGNGVFNLRGFLQNIKLTVTEMVFKVSDYLQNIFPTAEKEKSSADESSKEGFMDNKTMGGTLMGLAMLVIMVVLVKRA
ncbi:hypothetical protein TanjilG_01116 [Lupinus angustifolius]|uniref:Uncharacterized protein n=1 Tax=Lupinus angustifolius TaxID=3871 RepID=A0A1J7GFL2_LUPAN|nr:PREDICTED: uncharacterized protein LOC109325351 [Lupinus angustifolius]OIV99141.1 hypothetical protein TanjilG_01116 [Lupinus angustifolius]